MTTPTLGRIVLYHSPEYRPLPAIVTQMPGEVMEPDTIGLTVFSQSGPYFVWAHPGEENNPAVNTWFWPDLRAAS